MKKEAIELILHKIYLEWKPVIREILLPAQLLLSTGHQVQSITSNQLIADN